MTDDGLSPPIERFVDYFAELGPRWGLPADACRVHAFLYAKSKPTPASTLKTVLRMNEGTIAEAIGFLREYRMVAEGPAAHWRTNQDPWAMLVAGLEERTKRELPHALSTLRQCHEEAISDAGTDSVAVEQIGRMVDLVRDLESLDARLRLLSPGLKRRIVGVSGRAARFFDASFGSRR